jgi:murein DD-endopeptidase MepM/ murein hydrolase activator NlpD
MELVLISNSKGALGRARLGVARLVTLATAVALLLYLVAYLGFQRGADSITEAITNDPQFGTSIWQTELISQRKLIADMRLDANSNLRTLAIRAGSLQAHVTRLDALAERLVQVADLDPGEFGLSDVPALGGPNSGNVVPAQWHSLLANLELLSSDLTVREDRLDALEALIFDRQLHEDMHPDGRPLDDGWISSGFGYRTHPVSGVKEFHNGIDFAGKPGLDVYSVGAGIVTWSGTRWGYGNLVEINHGNGYVTRYAHNKKNLVGIGDKVNKDSAIALLGSTGRSTGPHVHFEVLRNGKVVNPWNFIKRSASR